MLAQIALNANAVPVAIRHPAARLHLMMGLCKLLASTRNGLIGTLAVAFPPNHPAGKVSH